MLEKCVYIPTGRIFEDTFNMESAIVINANIKPCFSKEIVKPMIPDKTVTTWGIVLRIKTVVSGEIIDIGWKLSKTVTSEYNDVPCIAKMKKKKKDAKNKTKSKIKESPIPTVLRAVGVDEWTDIIGKEIRVKSIGGTNMGISPIDEKNGRWFYPDYFEIPDVDNKHEDWDEMQINNILSRFKEVQPDLSAENSVKDPEIRNVILRRLVAKNKDFDGDIIDIEGVSYFVDGMKGIICKVVKEDASDNAVSNETDENLTDDPCKETPAEEFTNFILDINIGDRYICQEDQDQFKQRFTKLYDAAFGREEKNAGHDYGLAKMNKFLEKQNIGYKIKVVYATEEKPRHWVIAEHDWSK